LEVNKPKKLHQGDKISIVSPSWGGPSVFPHIYEAGIEVLREMGLEIVEFPTARASARFLYENPQARAEDINNAFADPDIKAIVTTIGGDDSVRILPYLDTKTIHDNPKILLGFSDSTTLLTYCNQQGVVTFNGPSVMAGFAQLKNFPRAEEHVKEMLFTSHSTYIYSSYEEFTHGYPDWKEVNNTGKVNELIANTEGWNWLQGSSTVKGKLFGGCIVVLEFLKGTDFWPPLDFWDDKILFLETSEEKPPPAHVKWMLRNYGMQGIYDRIVGILFGRPRDYSLEEKNELNQAISDVLNIEFNKSDLPIVTNMDFGHTDPQNIIPLGIQAEINIADKTVKLVEPVVK
jgi:muramoyltetrapeptide carboxypeptidase LdcA involved in peptidoglycan recycling